MPWTNKHISWLKKKKANLKTADGKAVEVWELGHNKDSPIISDWAKHFRNHYCLDTQIDELINNTGRTRAQYLTDIKFPDQTTPPGPSIRAGDFAEILVLDYLQYVCKYWVPRTRYSDKPVRNESTKGCDIIGFMIAKPGKKSRQDTLAIFEAKAQLTGTKPKPRLQDAINDSIKDEIRKAESLNAIKQRYLDAGNNDNVSIIERFQNFSDSPYREHFGAAAVFSNSCFCPKTIATSTTIGHSKSSDLALIVIQGEQLMELVHLLYQRAADEA